MVNDMPVSDEYLQFVVDQLDELGEVRAGKAFGQAVLFCDEVPFAYVIDDVLYFKVDDGSRPDYEQAGITAWVTSDRNGVNRSYEVPADVLEDRAVLKCWAEKAIAAAKQRTASGR